MKNRRSTRVLNLGGVQIGGAYPVRIQSMTNTKTADIPATLAQIEALVKAGCDFVRLAVPDQAAADALPTLVRAAPCPLVADIHFDYRLALRAIAAGMAGLRLNPGNIGSAAGVQAVAAAAKDAGTVIRIGVNGGSLEKELLERYGGVTAKAMVESALRHCALLEDCGFADIKLSLKATSLPLTLAAYRGIADRVDYPLHIGLTEAGTRLRGSIHSAMTIGILLEEGIGDTIRVSLAGDPLAEVWTAKEILRGLELLPGGFTVIACPTCGRTEIDVEGIARQIENALAERKAPRPVKIAVMGCVVNGPGEARDADIGIAGGKGEGLLFCKGEICGKYANDRLAAALLAKLEEIL